jgi:hypothetical protein
MMSPHRIAAVDRFARKKAKRQQALRFGGHRGLALKTMFVMQPARRSHIG